MFAFCTFQTNCVFNYFVWCQLRWATNRIIRYVTCDSQRARKDGKSSHRARDVLPRECYSWPSYLQASMDPFGGRKTTCRYQKNMMPMIQGQLQFEHVALLSATYRKLVHWLQISTKAFDGKLTFVWAHIHMACHSQTNASHVLVHRYTPIYWLITSVNFYVPIFANWAITRNSY